MKSLMLIKLGGSLITDKSRPYTVREDTLRRLCGEIHEVRKAKGFPMVVGHGGGSFPHVSAKKYQTHRGAVGKRSWEGFVKVQNDAATLNRIVVSNLIEAGEKAISFQPSASCMAKEEEIKEWETRQLEMSLSRGLLPVPYGDVCLDEKKGFCILSTEEILRFLARKLKPERIIIVGKTDGVLDVSGKIIRHINKKNLKRVERALMPSDGVADVTGGMMLKVKKSLEMGVEVEIINGLKPDVLKRCLMGEKGMGTVIRG